jgi:plasmid stability protein
MFDTRVTCKNDEDMSKTIQLRHVPDELHRKLKARAALERMSLSDYLLREIEEAASYPTVAELRQKLAGRTPFLPRIPPAKVIRAERGRPRSLLTPR